MSQIFLFVRKVADRAGAKGRNSNIWTQHLSRLAWDQLIFHQTRTKKQLKKSLHIWLSELFLEGLFASKQLIYDFLAGNNCPNWPHSEGGIKFATQTSPLLN